jgi:hypothetical protein
MLLSIRQWPAAEALHKIGTLPQPPAGRGGRVTRLRPTGSLLKGPGGDRHRHGDECQLPGPPLCSDPHVHGSSHCLESITGWFGWLASQQVDQDGEDD